MSGQPHSACSLRVVSLSSVECERQSPNVLMKLSDLVFEINVTSCSTVCHTILSRVVSSCAEDAFHTNCIHGPCN